MKKIIYLLLISSATCSLPMLMDGDERAAGVGSSEQTSLLDPTTTLAKIPDGEGQDHKEEETVSKWCLPRMKEQLKNNCNGCWRDTKRSCDTFCTEERKAKLDTCCDANYKCLCMCCLYTDDGILGRLCPETELDNEGLRMRAREQRMGSCVGGACCANIIWLAILAS